MDRRASRNQILLATIICLAAITILTVFLALRNILPGSIQTFLFVVLGDTLVGIVLYKLLEDEKPQLEIMTIREDEKLGFQIITRRKSLHFPRVILNGIEQQLQERYLPEKSKIDIMYVDQPYVFFPFRLECSLGSESWIHIKVLDMTRDQAQVLVAEMNIDIPNARARTNATSVPQTLIFNSEELEEHRRLELAFDPVANYVGPMSGARSPNDLVDIRLVEYQRKSIRKRLGL